VGLVDPQELDRCLIFGFRNSIISTRSPIQDEQLLCLKFCIVSVSFLDTARDVRTDGLVLRIMYIVLQMYPVVYITAYNAVQVVVFFNIEQYLSYRSVYVAIQAPRVGVRGTAAASSPQQSLNKTA
jgi:hypothetical protein